MFPKAIDLRPRFLSLINSCLPHIIFRTINSDNDALSLEKDFTNVVGNMKLSFRIWRFQWPGFDSRHGNSTSEIFRRTNCRILRNLRSTVVDKFGSPPHHYNDFWFFFFILTIVWSTDVITFCRDTAISFFGIIFRTIDSDTDPLLLKTDLKAVEEHSKNVNIKIERD